MKKRIYLFFAFVFSSCFLLPKQKIKPSWKKKGRNTKEIKEIQGEYDKLKGKTKQIVGQYNLLTEKLNYKISISAISAKS
jgi:hypothetical protein